MADDMQEIYTQYAQPVYRYLLSLCGSPQDAEEMCAETFYRAVKSINRYNGECKMLTWLCQIAKHVWYKELERRKRRGHTADGLADAESPAPAPQDAAEENEARLELYRRMQGLDDATREVMYLRLTGELSFKEIGGILGKTENWARVTFYRGKEKMKNE